MANVSRAAVVGCVLWSACRVEAERAPDATETSARAGTSSAEVGGAAASEPAGAGSVRGEGGATSSVAAGGDAVNPSGAGIGSAGNELSDAGEGDAGGDATAGAGGATICAGQSVTLDEVRRGEVREGARVAIDAVATSQKFLVSHARSGSCLWGAFVGAEPEGGEPRGLFVVSFGDAAPEDQACPPGSDGIPDALAPGDAVRALGRLSTYAPGGCSGIVPEPQLAVEAECPVQRAGRRELPAAVRLSLELADALSQGSDPALIGRFAGGLVRLEDVNGVRAEDGEGVVGAFGVVRFEETRLSAHNDVPYADLSGAGPGDPRKSLAFPFPTRFRSISGPLRLDYCTWSLAPRDSCTDFDPPSAGCGP